MAVAETASSCSKSSVGTSTRRRKSSNCFQTTKSSQFSVSNLPLAQQMRGQAAPRGQQGQVFQYNIISAVKVS